MCLRESWSRVLTQRSTQPIHPLYRMYLSRYKNIFVWKEEEKNQIQNCICLNLEIYLSRVPNPRAEIHWTHKPPVQNYLSRYKNVFVWTIFFCCCLSTKLYLSRSWNLIVSSAQSSHTDPSTHTSPVQNVFVWVQNVFFKEMHWSTELPNVFV